MIDPKQTMRVERSAGGVVIRKVDDGFRVLVIQDSHSRWSFPKGRIEAGETPVQAAQRETTEEVGIRNLTVVTSLGTSDFWFVARYEQPGQKVHKLVDHFLFETDPGAEGQAQEPDRVQRLHWVHPKELRGLVTYKTLKPIVERALQAIAQYPLIQ